MGSCESQISEMESAMKALDKAMDLVGNSLRYAACTVNESNPPALTRTADSYARNKKN
jgi:hypothetical protein